MTLNTDAITKPHTLLLHGFTGAAADWENLLHRSPAMLAIDLPGHANGLDPQGTFTEEVQCLLDCLPASIDCLIGYSLGGRIALGLLQAAPTRWRAITLISTHPGLVDVTARAARRVAEQRWVQLLREQGLAAFVTAWEQQPLFASQARLAPRILERQRRQRLAQRAEGLARSLECFGLSTMPSFWAALTDFTGQLHWLVGAEDTKFCAIARQVQALRSQTLLHVLPETGHNLLLESPKSLQWLLEQPCGGRCNLSVNLS